MTMKHNNPKPMGCSKSNSKREVYGNTILSQETIKESNRQPNSIPKTTGKWRKSEKKKTNPKVSRRKDHKDQRRNKWKRNDGNNSKD